MTRFQILDLLTDDFPDVPEEKLEYQLNQSTLKFQSATNRQDLPVVFDDAIYQLTRSYFTTRELLTTGEPVIKAISDNGQRIEYGSTMNELTYDEVWGKYDRLIMEHRKLRW